MPSKKINFLVVEDDDLARLALTTLLSEHGKVREAKNSTLAKKLLSDHHFDMAWIDLDMDYELEGLDLLPLVVEKEIYSVILSGRDEDHNTRKCYEVGCQDYLCKPFNKASLELILKRYSIISNQTDLKDFFANHFITCDQGLIDHLSIINEVLLDDTPINITGPTGVGKSLVAKLIHQLSSKSNVPFINLNCSETPLDLLESELFGYKKGAFSGADHDKKGKLHLADEGILFLDEIATMPMTLQEKILKAIEEKTFYPLGSEKPVTSNFRLISATCENLLLYVEQGLFRADLFHRIDGHQISLSPLSQRKNDIPHLIHYFLRSSPRRIILTDEVRGVLNSYSWPGNTRELKKTIELLQSKFKGIIDLQCLPEKFISQNKKCSIDHDFQLPADCLALIQKEGLKKYLEKIERSIVEYVHKKNNLKVSKTITDLQISNSSFYRIMGKGSSSDPSGIKR